MPVDFSLYLWLRRLIEIYRLALEVEADERLYVRPSLGWADCHYLFARRWFSACRAREPRSDAEIADLLKVSHSTVAVHRRRCEAAGAIEATNALTSAGAVAATVTQYVHAAWAERHFPAASRSFSGTDVERMLPAGATIVAAALDELDDMLGSRPRESLYLAAYASLGARASVVAAAKVLEVQLSTGYQLHKRAALGKDFLVDERALSQSGQQRAHDAQDALRAWTRRLTSAMERW